MVEGTGFENRQARKGLESSNLSASAMRILAIETSCDETAVALLDISGPVDKPSIKVLGNSLQSQAHLHQQYGGVYPNLAKREHQKNLPILLEKTLKEACEDLDSPKIDYISVTQGPGLEPALWTGITFARALAATWRKPLVPVNHMAGHIYSVLYEAGEPLKLPALALLVSGGHTELVQMKEFGSYHILGRTRDDAVGEAFDKVARMLSLPYPGGPQISALAEADRRKHPEPRLKFPRPMLHSGGLDFSYSGLKTAVLYAIKDLSLDEETRAEVARAFEDAAVEVLVSKTRAALEAAPDTATLIVGGGVAANKHLRAELSNLQQEFPSLSILFPTQPLTTDNAVMIGMAAYVWLKTNPSKPEDFDAQGNLLLGS